VARGKGEGSLYKRASDGLWCTTIELPAGPDGKRRRKTVCRKDKGSVVKELRKLQEEIAKHGDLPTQSPTLDTWMRHWLDDIAKVRPKTLEGYRNAAEAHIIPALGKRRIDKITAQHVRDLHKRVMNTPKDKRLRGTDPEDLPDGTEMMSSTSALLVHNTLSLALKAAHREGRIRGNPCELVDRPSKRITNEAALDVDEAIRLLAFIAPREDRALWATCLLTGARRGEVLGLEADRVGEYLDLSWQLQRLQDITKAPADWEYRHLDGTLYLTRPKSSAGWRVLPLVDPLRSILSLHMGDQTEGFVFTDNGRRWDPDKASKVWKDVLREAGLRDDVKLHGLRHTAVDLLYEAGVPEDLIQDIVGHSSRAVTRGYRRKGMNPRMVTAMRQMAALVAQDSRD
jgi:integrase